jgi:hypothetical protein
MGAGQAKQEMKAWKRFIARSRGFSAVAVRGTCAALLALAVLSCGPAVQVGIACDPATSFSAYKTFAMLEPNRAVPTTNTDVDPFVLLRLRQLTYLKLRSMGFSPVGKATAELVVSIHAAKDQEIFVHSPPLFYDDPYPGHPIGMWSPQVTRIDEGIVVIDMIDREKKAVVWRGTGVRALGADFEEEELREMVDAILQRFPPNKPPSHDP